ncbi:MAG: MiaB/RimO family radical SAM methylthiotransferase [Desulfovibrio sp.]|jgi:MiaB/RimO family radical SAM methylthiotransferase|nr:MiaB/RimO family radical SAM methylthiotransferase [Desulfovibrio sp.]
MKSARREKGNTVSEQGRDEKTATAGPLFPEQGRSFFLATLGCKVNQYESQALAEAWLARGWTRTERPEEAEVLLINTCAVTERAVAEARSAARRLRRTAPKALLFLAGCAAEALPAEFSALPGPVRIIGQRRKPLLARQPLASLQPGSFLREDAGPFAPFPDLRIAGYNRSRAVLKIQDGCSRGCAYCIVPRARGAARSRPPEEILAEAGRLLKAGFREIILSGVNLGQYSCASFRRRKGNFWDLLVLLEEALAPRWAGRARLRVSSLDPAQLTEQALDVLARCRLPAPHLHLSLQSGSLSVLRRMGRDHYEPAAAASFLDKLRRLRPVFGLGADILTGFPEESEAEFQETLALCRILPLSYAHVFSYSPRPGTAAAVLSGQVPPEEKKRRASLLRQTARRKKEAFLAAQLNLPVVRVVFEHRHRPAEKGEEAVRGMNEYYIECRLEEGPAPLLEIVPVRPVRLEHNALMVARTGAGG